MRAYGLLVIGLAACGPTRAPQEPAPPALALVTWTTTLDRAHPLVGVIWQPAARARVTEGTLRKHLHGYVLLGEKHDNPDHHRLQARLLAAMVESGAAPAVAFEQFDTDAQPAIAQARDVAALAVAAHWKDSGWPPWELYAPIAQIALDRGLPILATGLPRDRMKALFHPDPGTPALPEGPALAEPQRASLAEELRDSHCGHLPESGLDAMIRFQRARDFAMTSVLLGAKRDDAVLVAGTGHTRNDRGVGRDLAALDPKHPVVSVAFVEVASGRTDPADYAKQWHAETLPFDYVWFTPRVSDDDPCAAFAK